MYEKILIVKVDSNYCDYLRKFDNKVTYNAGKKELRPFIGVLFIIDKREYFAPLSSPKEKHKGIPNKLDFLKIDNGKLGAINLNNMIPVTINNYKEFDLNKKVSTKEEQKRIDLLSNQLRWLTANREKLISNSNLLYNLYKSHKLNDNVVNRCCNFILLEKKCKEYNK